MRLSKSLFGLFLLVTFLFADGYRMGGYYRSWAQDQYRPQDIPFDRVTHIFHAFAWPDAQGNLKFENGFLNSRLVELTHAAQRKILLSLGGASDSYGFSPMVADNDARAQFIDQVCSFLQKYHYDGVDIDWEFPQSADDRINLVKLVNELRNALNQLGDGYLITMAIPVGNWYGQWFQFDVLKNSVDWFNAMTYDFHGSWTNHSGHEAPLYSPAPSIDNCGSVDDGIKYLLYQRGIPAGKILLGLAFFGRQFNTTGLYRPATGGDLTYGYNEIVPLIGNGWIYYWDNISKVPYLRNSAGNKLITYDDTLSIALKCRYALDKHLAGCMYWAMGHDKIGNRQPLLQKAAEILNIQTAIVQTPGPQIPTDLRLTAFPNPFNARVTFGIYCKTEQTVRLRIVTVDGRSLATLLFKKHLNPGLHTVVWQADRFASGEYIAVLQSTSGLVTKKVVLVK